MRPITRSAARRGRLLLSLLVLLPPGPLGAARADDCSEIEDEERRLACYDEAARKGTVFDKNEIRSPSASRPLADRWELDPGTRRGTFQIRPYKPIYFLPGYWTSDTNTSPTTEPYGAAPEIPYDDVEAKFQFSLKTKVWQGVAGDAGDLWVAYTQVSNWQLYNAAISRPFRETNYEPEVLLTFAADYPAFGFRGRLLGVSLTHQSNGRSEPLSRSWNRIVFLAGFERDGWAMVVRPWFRINEDLEDDDNPRIEDYMGRAELLVMHRFGGHEVDVTARHSLRFGDRSHGSLRVDWAFPISGNLRGHVQVFTGYGDTMIDYNHRQTTVGVGVSLLEWL